MTSLPSTELEKQIADLCGTTRVAAHLLSRASSETINQALGFIAEEITSFSLMIGMKFFSLSRWAMVRWALA